MNALQPGMNATDLRAWARQHAVERWLDAPARVLQQQNQGQGQQRTWFWLYRQPDITLERLLTATPARSLSETAADRVPVDLQQAAIKLLRDQATLAEEALAEEQARLAGLMTPLHHRLRPLFERLLEVRESVRAHAHPRPDRDVGPAAISLMEDPPRIRYREQSSSWCSGDGYWPELTIELQPSEGQSTIQCRCKTGCASHCPVGLSALDASLELLSNPQQADLQRRIVRLLATPRWSRTLEALDRVLQRGRLPADLPEDEALGWRLKVRDSRPLTLEPIRCRPNRTRGGLRGWRIEPSELRQHPHLLTLPVDGEVLDQLDPAPDVPLRSRPDALQQAHTHRAIEHLIGHPRVLVGTNSEPVPVRHGTLSLRWQTDETGWLALQPALDDVPLPLKSLVDLLHSRLAGGRLVIVEPDQCVVIRVGPGVAGLFESLLTRGFRFPPEAIGELMERRADVERLLPVRLSADLRGDPVQPDLSPILCLQALSGDAVRLSVRIRPMLASPPLTPGEGSGELYGEDDGVRIFIQRDLEDERAMVRRQLTDLDLPPEEEAPFQWVLTGEAAMAMLIASQQSPHPVEWEGPPRRVTSPATASALKLKVIGRQDWFGLKGTLTVEGATVSLEALLDAITGNHPFVQAESGDWIRLDPTLRQRLLQAASVLGRRKGGLGFSPLNALSVAALEEAGAAVVGPKKWSGLLSRIEKAQEAPVPPPVGLTVTLRDYQLTGYQWMMRLASWGVGAILADDMGLGKTVQALALLSRRAGPALVIAPTSVCLNWGREAARFAPGLTPRRYAGSDRAELLSTLSATDLLICSYATMTRDAEALCTIRFGTIVFDEAQALKNPATRRTRAATALDGAFRLALSGTPIENRTSELWSLFNVIAPGLLGDWEHFREHFAGPIEREDDAERRSALARLLEPFLLRRLKSEVASELPARTEIVVPIVLSEAEMALYNEVRVSTAASLAKSDSTEQRQRIQVLAAITRLRQLACHPKLYDPDSTIPSAKLARLRQIIAELRSEGHRALVFSQFTRHLNLVQEALTADGASILRLDGSTPMNARQDRVDAFQAGQTDVFLISLRAGGVGLTLTAATYVIHLDPWWNPAVEDQATDRAHRIGQHLPVTVYRLISTGTIESSILSLHGEKRQLVDDLLADAGGAAALSVSELAALIARSGQEVPALQGNLPPA
ncbi:MAG: superfamily II DNA or RNA helicase [Myxococcota bacterium]|jgi:superfamily II DNA or RNA helicase